VFDMLSWLYGLAATTRRRCYQSGLLASTRLAHPVLSVGNLTIGGTGKTPLVMYLARVFQSSGFHPAILTRGYRGRAEKSQLLVSDGSKMLCEAAECGDEAFLMAQKLPGLPVAVGRKRSLSARLIPGYGADEKLVFLLDDGFQHLQLERDLDLLVLDATDPFASGRVLPFGRLREPLAALERADRLVVTRAHLAFDQEALETEIRLRNRLAPITYFYHDASGLVEPATARVHPMRDFAGKRVIAFSGIGNPQVFLRDLQHYQLRIIGEFLFRDHHAFSQAEVDQIWQAAESHGAEAVVTTEKDAVRLHHLRLGRCPLLALQIEAKPEDPGDFDRQVVDEIRQGLGPFK
jgi:tetraacyldisaccharide 4'-kinase